MKTPSTQWEIPKNIQKSNFFGQKHAFFECFRVPQNITAVNLYNTLFLFCLTFSQFLPNFCSKGLILRVKTYIFVSTWSEKAEVKRKIEMDSRT